jgi:hypothetical protein
VAVLVVRIERIPHRVERQPVAEIPVVDLDDVVDEFLRRLAPPRRFSWRLRLQLGDHRRLA